VCARGFVDYIVNEFYNATGKTSNDPGERRKWLEGRGAVEFVKTHPS